ncbi:MAG: polysaccharide biosynthesis/export family protein [Pseudomonadota bacterium]
MKKVRNSAAAQRSNATVFKNKPGASAVSFFGTFKVLALAAVAAAVSLVAAPLSAQAQTDSASVPSYYKLNPGDVIQLFAFDDERLSREVVVLPDGRINLPAIGEVQVAGRTVAETEAMIVRAYVEAEFLLRDSTVSVIVTQATGNRVYILGQVQNPGVYSTLSRVNVLQAISLAGGITPFASERKIKVLRTLPNGRQEAFEFDYRKAKRGRALSQNITLMPGDTVLVP